MRFRYFLHLLALHLRQYPGRTVLAFVVLVAASVLMLVLADAGAALRFRVGERLSKLFPEERMRLEVRRGSIGPIAIEVQSITPATVAALAARPDVLSVLPIEPVRVPVSVQGEIFGQQIASDAVIHGVPLDMVRDVLKPGQPWAIPPDTNQSYPVVASRYFLDLYNLGLARSGGLPLLSPDAIIGRHFKVVLGQSSVVPMPASPETGELRAEIVGLSGDPSLIGLAMPAEAVRAINYAYGSKRPPEYVALVVTLKSAADSRKFLADVSNDGLVLPGGETLGRQIKTAVGAAGWTLIGLAASVFGMGMMTFYLLFAMTFHSRRLDLVRLRAFGVGPAALLGLALGEVAGVSVLAVALAGGLNYVLMTRANAMAAPWLADQSWLPANLLEPSIFWLVLTSTAILAAPIAAAAPMLRWVFRVEPGQVIRDL